MASSDKQETSIDRRTCLATIASAGAASIAGCGGMTSSSGEQGERVPELIFEFTTGLGNFSNSQKAMAEIVSNNLSERLGVSVTARAKEFTTMFDEQGQDARAAHMYAAENSNNPSGLNPSYIAQLYHVQYAGAEDGFNMTQYANCKFSDLVEEERFATSRERVQELVQQYMQVFSQDIANITLYQGTSWGTFNQNHIVVDQELLGEMGPGGYNYNFLIKMKTKGDVTPSVNISTPVVGTNVHTRQGNVGDHAYWVNTIYSTMYKYNQNYELEKWLADSVETANDFKTIRITIKDATFHNGDPVTAEDVKFTWDLYGSPHDALTTGAGDSSDNLQSVEVIDDKTIEWTFLKSTPGFLEGGSLTYYGILPKALWEEKLDGDFANLPNLKLNNEDIYGSGPYKFENLETNALLNLSPNEDHYMVTPSQGLVLRAYTGSQAAYRAYQDGELSIYYDPSVSQIRELEKDDRYYTVKSQSPFTGFIAQQMSYPPFQFQDFRLGASQAINRREVNQVALQGEATPLLHSLYLSPVHPSYPGTENLTKIAPSPEGSQDVARQTLSEAGYTWDNNDRLRYPADKDLTPKWPKGESPMDHPDEWPCAETIPEGY